MFVLLISTACFGWTLAAPSAGTCMCVTASSLNVRNAAGLSSHVVAAASHGECYVFNGGILTKDGHTWYELQNVHGHHRVWTASEYLHASSHSHCSGGSGGSGGSSTGTHSGDFASGIVSKHCLQCICTQESGCKAIGCHFDVNSDSCGYFQIKEGYWHDCGSPGTSWHACANDIHCASQCVQNYMKRYASHYGCPMTCESFAREHNGGPNGCHHSSTIGYWHGVQGHSGCSGVH